VVQKNYTIGNPRGGMDEHKSQGTGNPYKDNDDHGPSGKRARHGPGGSETRESQDRTTGATRRNRGKIKSSQGKIAKVDYRESELF